MSTKWIFPSSKWKDHDFNYSFYCWGFDEIPDDPHVQKFFSNFTLVVVKAFGFDNLQDRKKRIKITSVIALIYHKAFQDIRVSEMTLTLL